MMTTSKCQGGREMAKTWKTSVVLTIFQFFIWVIVTCRCFNYLLKLACFMHFPDFDHMLCFIIKKRKRKKENKHDVSEELLVGQENQCTQSIRSQDGKAVRRLISQNLSPHCTTKLSVISAACAHQAQSKHARLDHDLPRL